jgi:hypothetical protein
MGQHSWSLPLWSQHRSVDLKSQTRNVVVHHIFHLNYNLYSIEKLAHIFKADKNIQAVNEGIHIFTYGTFTSIKFKLQFALSFMEYKEKFNYPKYATLLRTWHICNHHKFQHIMKDSKK